LHPYPVSADPDEHLLMALAEGDPEAIAAVYRRHGASMVAFARRYVHDVGAAEDIVIGLIGRWLERPPRIGSVERISAFLATSVYHAAIDWIRHERAAQGRPPRDEVPHALLKTAPVTEPASGASRESMRTHLARALEEMRDDERLLLESHYGHALTTEECMSQLGITRAAFHQRLHRARAHLAQLLETDT
jgi:RNA polymerase sigma-70 factor, ECF subfamily